MYNRGRNTFSKSERLCSKKLITGIFEEGYVFHSVMLRVVWLPVKADLPAPAQVAMIIPKKNIRSAVARNFIRRRMREAYRKHKFILYDYLEELNLRLVFALIYKGLEPVEYRKIEESVIEALKTLNQSVKQKFSNLVKDR
jgi:ribonuclease P protein component